MARELTVGIGGLGAIGLHLARALDAGVEGLRLVAVASRDQAKARDNLAGFRAPPALVDLPALAEHADIVVEAAPASVFEAVATAAIERGRIFVPSSVGALLARMHLVERARATGARIVVPTGALLGLDAVRAAAEGEVSSVTIETRKPRAAWPARRTLRSTASTWRRSPPRRASSRATPSTPRRASPANVNVAAALALAGIGPQRTTVEIWADPGVTRNTHTIRVEAASARLTMTIENVPSEENPPHGQNHAALDPRLPARADEHAEGRS
jgi:aspartate dehydrogenase